MSVFFFPVGRHHMLASAVVIVMSQACTLTGASHRNKLLDTIHVYWCIHASTCEGRVFHQLVSFYCVRHLLSMHLSSCLLKVVKPASTHLETPQWPCQDLRPAFWSHESHWRLPTDTNTKPYNTERLLSLSASLVWNNNPINGLSKSRGFEMSSPRL